MLCVRTAGIGLLPYRQLLEDLAAACPQRPILALEYKHVSMRLTSYVPRWVEVIASSRSLGPYSGPRSKPSCMRAMTLHANVQCTCRRAGLHAACASCWQCIARPRPLLLGRCSVDEVAAAVADVLGRLGYSRAALIGHSYGSLVASRFSKLHPEKVVITN